MKRSLFLTSAALIGILANGCGSMMGLMGKKSGSSKKIHCKGIATKWVNDCGANKHKCAGQAKSNFDRNEWLKMSEKDCMTVQKALKNKAVRSYVERIQKGTVVATKRGKKF